MQAVLSWKSKKQSMVATSSTEAEYLAACFATKEAVFLRNLIQGIGRPQKTIVVCTDNASSQKLIGNPIHHELTKHIKTQYHYTCEMVRKGEVSFVFVPTRQMVADSLTKEVGKEKTRFCSMHMGIRPKQGFEPKALLARRWRWLTEKTSLDFFG